MDKLLSLLFQPERWKAAIAKGIVKDIRKDQLYQLTKPEVRTAIYGLVKEGKYRISPPHTAQIPKDKPGEFRTVYVNEPVDRILLSIVNDLLFELCPTMVHPRCKSYLKGTGCGKVVKEVSRRICEGGSGIVGWKSDLSKYFDTVPIGFIDATFDKVDAIVGKSVVIDLLRQYYHTDLYFDEEGNLLSGYQSLKQGCAVAAFLADAVLFDIDKVLGEKYDGYYVRYSDDMLFIGPDYVEAMEYLRNGLGKMQMSLNPKKVEYLSADRWFKFLGFSVKGGSISLAAARLKTFQKEIEMRTIKNRKQTYRHAVNSVNRFLYKGDGVHSWATQILPVINVDKDIETINAFVMDCLRAVQTGRRHIGGLGYVCGQKDGCVMRGKGRNVSSNRVRTDETLDGYRSIACMRNALLMTRSLYDAFVLSM